MCGDMLWWIPKILHAEWAQRRGEKSFWLIHRPSQIWNCRHKPSAMASIKLVDGIAESFRKEPRRARRKNFWCEKPPAISAQAIETALMDMAQVYTLCCIPRALRWPLGKECRVTCWAEVWRKKRKKFLIPYAHHSRKNWRQEKPKQVAIQTRPEKY